MSEETEIAMPDETFRASTEAEYRAMGAELLDSRPRAWADVGYWSTSGPGTVAFQLASGKAFWAAFRDKDKALPIAIAAGMNSRRVAISWNEVSNGHFLDVVIHGVK